MNKSKSNDAHLRAVQKYKQKVKRITLEFHPTEEGLWQHIQSQPKKQTYIKCLIRADMEK
jgi:hypothetical protein